MKLRLLKGGAAAPKNANTALPPPPAPVEYRAQLTPGLSIVLEPGGATLWWNHQAAGLIRCRERALVLSIPQPDAARSWRLLAARAEKRLQQERSRLQKPVDLNRIVWAWILDLIQLGATPTEWRISDHIDLEHGAEAVSATAYERAEALRHRQP